MDDARPINIKRRDKYESDRLVADVVLYSFVAMDTELNYWALNSETITNQISRILKGLDESRMIVTCKQTNMVINNNEHDIHRRSKFWLVERARVTYGGDQG